MITGELGKSAAYSRREYAALFGLGWHDGRDATIVMNHWHAKRRSGTQVFTSRYSLAEVKQVGWAGRAFVIDKEIGNEEHGETKPGDRLPPYTIRTREFVGPDGEVTTVATCECTAQACQVGHCRHCDVVLKLIDEGVLEPKQIDGI